MRRMQAVGYANLMYCKCRGVRVVGGLAWDGRLSSVTETGHTGFYFGQALISDARPI